MLEVKLIKIAIDSQVATIQEKLNGAMLPTLSKYEALRELGTISALVIGIYDQIEDDVLKEQVWQLKAGADNLYQQLMDL